MVFDGPQNLLWSAKQTGFAASDTLSSNVSWRDFRDGSSKLCLVNSSEPAVLHLYASVSGKNFKVSFDGDYHISHAKQNVDDTVKSVTQHFCVEQPWGSNLIFANQFTKSISNLAELQAKIGRNDLEPRHLIMKEGSGDKIKFSTKLFTLASLEDPHGTCKLFVYTFTQCLTDSSKQTQITHSRRGLQVMAWDCYETL
jgi:hypothetical protein